MIHLRTSFQFTLLFLLLTTNSTAQIWFDIGLNAGAGTSFITQQGFYQVNQVNFIPKLNTTYSGKIGVNFTDNHALVIDLGVNNRAFSIDQNEIPGYFNTDTYRMDFGLSGFRVGSLYRHTNEGSFIELGPEFGRVSSSYVNDICQCQFSFENYVRGVLGIGGYVLGNKRVTLVVGLRMMYDFTDLRSELTKELDFPFQNYPEIEETSPLQALEFQVNFELNISLGFLYRNNCGLRTLMFKW
jgi:hypothetical protein